MVRGSIQVCLGYGFKASLLLLCAMPQLHASDVISTSPQGNVVATAAEGGLIELRPISSGGGIVTLQHEGVPPRQERRSSAVSWIPRFVFSPDGRVLASVCAWLPVTLWDVKTGEMLRKFANSGVGYELRFSADGSRLIGSGLVNKVGLQRLTLWDVETGKILREINVDTPLMDEAWDRNSIRPRFAKSGPMLVIEVINGRERSLMTLNTASNKQTLVLKIDRLFPADWVISSDGKYLIVREYSRDGEGVKRHRMFEMVSGDEVKSWAPVGAEEK